MKDLYCQIWCIRSLRSKLMVVGSAWTVVMFPRRKAMQWVMLSRSTFPPKDLHVKYVENVVPTEMLWAVTWEDTRKLKSLCFDNSFELLLFYSDLEDMISQYMARTAEGLWQCTVCSITSNKKSNVKCHVEAKHLQTQGWQCHICNKHCPSKNAYNVHFHRNHKGM